LEHTKEFSRFAKSYDANTVIQKEVAKKLVGRIKGKPQNILDLGCGSGAVYKNLSFTCRNFIGIDSSKEMCRVHPQEKNIKIYNKDFEFLNSDSELNEYGKFDLIISSSALQWAKNLKNIMKFCKKHSDEILFALFTPNTFKSIFEFTNLTSPLLETKEVLKTVQKYYKIKYEICCYKLYFEDNISKFRYIKRSGVSGGKKRLNVTETKNLIKNYPYDYLEFEVIYIQSV
jgi:malonyl-CoA O-methyltransferase